MTIYVGQCGRCGEEGAPAEDQVQAACNVRCSCQFDPEVNPADCVVGVRKLEVELKSFGPLTEDTPQAIAKLTDI